MWLCEDKLNRKTDHFQFPFVAQNTSLSEAPLMPLTTMGELGMLLTSNGSFVSINGGVLVSHS